MNIFNQWSFKGECYEYYNYVYECPFVTPTFVTPIHWTWEWISYLSVVILVMYRLWILEPINSALLYYLYTWIRILFSSHILALLPFSFLTRYQHDVLPSQIFTKLYFLRCSCSWPSLISGFLSTNFYVV